MIKSSNKRILSLFAILGIATLASLEAHAGAKFNYPIQVSNTYIEGGTGTARNSTDASQYLYISDFSNTMSITAQNSAGLLKTCTTNDPTYMSALRGATTDVYLRTFISAGVCTNMSVYKGSIFEPKNP